MDMFEGFLRQSEFNVALETLEKKLGPTSRKAELDHCNQCGICCWRRPGEFAGPEDLAASAKLVNMDPPEFFRTFCVVDDLHNKLTVVPRRSGQADVAGTYLNSDRTYDIDTPCVFLNTDSNECRIHEAKPQACVEFKCWNPVKGAKVHSWSEEDMKALGWDGNRANRWDEDDEEDDGDN